MKQYAVIEDGQIKEIIRSNVKRPNYFQIDNTFEKFHKKEWLQLESIEQDDGSFKQVVTVNSALKKEMKDQEKIDKDALKALEDIKKDELNTVKNKIKDFDKSRLVGLEQIQDTLDSIVKFLKDKYNFNEGE